MNKVIEINHSSKAEREEMKNAYTGWLASFNTRYQLTITFRAYTSAYKTRRMLNSLLEFLNKKIYKKRYRHGKSYLRGFAIREKTYGLETDHFHILILDDAWLPNRDRMHELIKKHGGFINRRLKVFTSTERINTFLLQDYYNEDENKLECYVTKDFDSPIFDYEKIDDFIGILGCGDVAFGQLNFEDAA